MVYIMYKQTLAPFGESMAVTSPGLGYNGFSSPSQSTYIEGHSLLCSRSSPDPFWAFSALELDFKSCWVKRASAGPRSESTSHFPSRTSSEDIEAFRCIDSHSSTSQWVSRVSMRVKTADDHGIFLPSETQVRIPPRLLELLTLLVFSFDD